jgi:hypothetical protein
MSMRRIMVLTRSRALITSSAVVSSEGVRLEWRLACPATA